MGEDAMLTFLRAVYAEAADLLGVTVGELTVEASVPDVAWQSMEAGESADAVAERLVEDEAIR